MGTPMEHRLGIELSDEERAEMDGVRDQYQDERPGPSDLVDRGEIDEPVPHGQFVELLSLVKRIKQAREEAGVSLTELSRRSGLTRAAISRLENGWNNNPTLDTLYRYALAARMHINLTAEPVATPGGLPEVAGRTSSQHLVPTPPLGSSRQSTHNPEGRVRFESDKVTGNPRVVQRPQLQLGRKMQAPRKPTHKGHLYRRRPARDKSLVLAFITTRGPIPRSEIRRWFHGRVPHVDQYLEALVREGLIRARKAVLTNPLEEGDTGPRTVTVYELART